MNVYKKISYLILFTQLFGCTKEINVKLPHDSPIPVMNCLLTKDSLMYVDLSFSHPISDLQNNFQTISTADVRLFKNGNFIEQMKGNIYDGRHLYTSTIKAEEGEIYKIEAKIPNENFAPVRGEAVVPKLTNIISGNFQKFAGSFGNTIYKTSITINDQQSAKNFYKLKLYPLKDGKIIRQEPIWFKIVNLKTGEGGIFEDFIETESSIVKYFDDYTFDGTQYKIELETETQLQFNNVAVELAAISVDTYLYYKSITLQKLRSDDPLFEKVPLFTNIENGLGILGAQSINYLKLSLSN